MTQRERVIRTMVAILAVATLGTSAWGIWKSLGGTHQNWGMFGFEVVIILSAGFALAYAMGKITQAPGLALACIAGSIIVSAGLGLIATSMGVSEVLRNPIFLARIALAGGFSVLAVVEALGTCARAWNSMIKGSVLAVGSLGVIGVGLATRSSWMASAGVLQVALIIAGILGLILMGAFFCVGVHMVIRAFEITTSENSPT